MHSPVDKLAFNPAARDAARDALLRLAERTHRAARAEAEGSPLRDVAALLGLPEARAVALLARPAFRELVAHYRKAA